jgi:hypothetical protein
MIREIDHHTRLKNRDVQLTLETLIYVWAETLVAGKRVEAGALTSGNSPRIMRRMSLRVSKTLKASIKDRMHVSSF